MDKKILENFAIESRQNLIEDTKTQLKLLGIDENGTKEKLENSTSDLYMFDIGLIEPHIINGKDIQKYESLVRELHKREDNADWKSAYDSLVEEVSYTWFNRLIAIRFMEVNNYLPYTVRILSSEILGRNEPEMVTYYRDLELDLSDREMVELDKLSSDHDNDKMFQKLFIKVCNDMNKYLPELFEKTDDYAELLLNISYTDDSGVVYKLVNNIPETYFDIDSEDGTGQVEIIGWLYQYYNKEIKEKVIDIKGKKIVKKEEIPAATQIFTTDWVVRYMVDNSLGKYWIERNPNSKLADSLEYLMPGVIEEIDEDINPEDIKVFDNAMGSGHILVYAFDILIKIYEERGYSLREAAISIIENNIYGLEIDKRAYQLAYFSVMMKGRQYNRGILNVNLDHNLRIFEDSYDSDKKYLDYFGQSMAEDERTKAHKEIEYLIQEFSNAKEIGSIMILEKLNYNLLREYIYDEYNKDQIAIDDININELNSFTNKFGIMIDIAEMLNKKYEIMVTNPPYLYKFSPELKEYIINNYKDLCKDYKQDLFGIFIYNNINMCVNTGYSAYMTPNVWMFIETYQKLREYIVNYKHIDSLIQIAKGAFFSEASVDVMTFVVKNQQSKEKGKYVRLEGFKGGMELQRERTLEAINNPNCGYYYLADQKNFEKIPGSPVAYWASENVIHAFIKGKPMNEIVEPKVGLQTGNNNKFLRLWWEVDYNKISFDSLSIEDSVDSGCKWFPYNKGGERRQWYGNYDYLVNWENDGREIRNFKDSNGKLRSRPQNTNYYFKEAISWNLITSGGFSIRFRSRGSIHDVSGMSAFSKDHNLLLFVLGLTSTKLSNVFFNILNPTINKQVGDFNNFPVLLLDEANYEYVIKIAEDNIRIAKEEWNSYEEAWDFLVHPFISHKAKNIEESFSSFNGYRNSQIEKMIENEVELNKIFISLYDLEDVLDSKITRDDITLRSADKEKDVKSFISYAVGCIMGRYSLDEEGLIFAGGEWDSSRYQTIKPDEDGLLIISEYDYIKDDAVDRFIDFVKKVYGEDSLEENLDFIAESLEGKGSAKEIIRNYFVKDFFKDHAKTYSVRRSGKRPIYWEYSSGNRNGFKALVYMHRYDADTTGKVRLDHLHKVEKMYDNRLRQIEAELEYTENAKEKNKLNKEKKDLMEKLAECKEYDAKLKHLANRRIDIDLDDGVKVNHEKIQLDDKGNNLEILSKI